MRTKLKITLVVLALVAPGRFSASRADEPVKQETAKSESDKAAEERIAFVRDKMQHYQIADRSNNAVPLQDSLALRWTNPVSGVVDGGIFVWTDGGCPAVVAKCWINEKKEAWGECIQSVSDRPLVANLNGVEVWTPESDVRFHLVEDEKPSATAGAAVRLSRMRQMMRRLKLTSLWGQEMPTPWELRPLTAPVFRYQSEKRGIVDGAVFAFTQGGTNPEALGLVEIREREGVRTCHIAVARLSTYALKATFDDKTIIDLERLAERDRKLSFHYGWHWFTRYPFPKSGDDAVGEPKP